MGDPESQFHNGFMSIFGMIRQLRGGDRVMATNQKAVTVLPESELGLTLRAAQASGELVIVDIGEDRYTLLVTMTEQVRDVFARYDPAAAVAGLRALDDAFAGVDRERLLRDLHAQRAQGSHGRPA
jgi:hypothetical protein